MEPFARVAIPTWQSWWDRLVGIVVRRVVAATVYFKRWEWLVTLGRM
jgi:hypothetical protein